MYSFSLWVLFSFDWLSEWYWLIWLIGDWFEVISNWCVSFWFDLIWFDERVFMSLHYETNSIWFDLICWVNSFGSTMERITSICSQSNSNRYKFNWIKSTLVEMNKSHWDVNNSLQISTFLSSNQTSKVNQSLFVSIAFETSKGWLNLIVWSRMQITVSCWVKSTWMCVLFNHTNLFQINIISSKYVWVYLTPIRC